MSASLWRKPGLVAVAAAPWAAALLSFGLSLSDATPGSAQMPGTMTQPNVTPREPTVEQTPPGAANEAVATFVKTAASGNLLEIETSRLALERATSVKVKEFAQRMIDDHDKAGHELGDLIASGRLGLDTTGAAPTMLTKHREMLQRLQDADGNAFDKTYTDIQFAAHQEAVGLFTAYAGNGTVPDLVRFASETLPTLKDHAEALRNLMN